MKSNSRVWVGLKALRELGPEQVGLNALYQLGLRNGYYQRQLSSALHRLNQLNRIPNLKVYPCLSRLPEQGDLRDVIGDRIEELTAQADEIVSGTVRLFGGSPKPLVLEFPGPLQDWAKYEAGINWIGDQDIKFIWEPGRFGWACTLARAYYLSGNERYADTFWDYLECFLSSNPPYLGPHWSSAQEVAIRLIALAFAIQVFIQSKRTTPERLESLARAIAVHAERIPPTMVYARSQNNNHLITEAIGLYTAAAFLRDHPLAPRWHRLGWKWLLYAFRTQISSDGSYIQHSTNYHRLMLQAALWMYVVHDTAYPTQCIPSILESRLAEATNWIWQLLDPESGRVPNLGHNDGAYFLPLTVCPYHDYRPVVYAAAQKFLHVRLTPDGPWCEMTDWLCPTTNQSLKPVDMKFWNIGGHTIKVDQGPACGQHNPFNESWAMFRVVSFKSRPAHADLLHLDLWWRGLNLAQDSGTYLYNAAPPWDNSFTSAFIHNTVTIDGQEFMQRAGRFLYLEWAQAKNTALEYNHENSNGKSIVSITASHNGYRKLAVVHTRQLATYRDGHWEILDRLTGSPNRIHTIRLHWLLPDWEYEIDAVPNRTDFLWFQLRIQSPYGWVSLQLGEGAQAEKTLTPDSIKLLLVRGGKLLYGSGEVNPIMGWFSPTYGEKIPALACILEVTQSLPITLKSIWNLPGEI